MGYVLSVYNEKICREFRLPDHAKVKQELLLAGQDFGCGEDVLLGMERTGLGWRLLDGAAYTIRREERKAAHESEIFRITFGKQTGAAVLLQKRSEDACVYQKLSLPGSGQLRIGKDAGNEIRCDVQNCVSGVHAVLEWKDGEGILHDLSRNGLYINHVRASRSTHLHYGDVLWIFGLKLVFLGTMLALDVNMPGLQIHLTEKRLLRAETLRGMAEAPRPGVKAEVIVYRSLRSLVPLTQEVFTVEGPPKPLRQRETPWYLTLGPSLTMSLPMVLGCMLTAARSEQAGAFLYTGLVTAIGSAVIGAMWGVIRVGGEKREARRAEEARVRLYQEYLAEREAQIQSAYEQAKKVLCNRYPKAALLCVQKPPFPELWSRNPGHEDFLFFRLGLGACPFSAKIVVPEERFSIYPDVLARQPQGLSQKYRILQGVPVGIDLRKHGLVGLVGGEEKQGAYELARELLLQVIYSCCYTEVKLVLLYDEEKQEERETFSAFRWIRHTWSGDGQMRFLAGRPEEISEVACALERILRGRREERENGMAGNQNLPHYLMVISDRRLLEGELLERYLKEDAAVWGMSALVLAKRMEELPNGCTCILSNPKRPGGFSGLYTVQDAENKVPVKFDVTSPYAAERFIRQLARLRTTEQETGTEIPERVTFFQMYQVEAPEQMKISERWSKKESDRSLRALIGEKAGGAPCFLDLHEKYHGPHGLIAGTTGSGKSELLQTLILALSIAYSPDEAAFFLIDYKGGGMANLFAGLPHLAGQISNLSGSMIRRALVSVKSENRRRQHIFAEYGVNNISAYIRLYEQGEAEDPIPHLFLIIDEFAELKREEPEFMRELVSVAQVGRSLGLHLILATQKPGGTVDDNIWSNARFRICLRVQDRQDSNDMLHHPDAAGLTQVGRCYLQVGNDEVYEQFQAGFCGAAWRRNAAEQDGVRLVTATGQTIRMGKRRSVRQAEPERTQLQVMVEHLAQTADACGYKRPLQLWLPVLPKRLLRSDLEAIGVDSFFMRGIGSSNQKTERDNQKIGSGTDGRNNLPDRSVCIGLSDDPEHQRQMPLHIDFLHDGGLAVYGGVGTGKSTVLQTILYELLVRYTPRQVHIYGMDFGKQNLRVFSEAPQVGGILFPEDPDRVRRCFHMLEELLRERKKLLSGGTYEQYLLRNAEGLPAVFLFIDDYAEFREHTENCYEELLIRISKEGLSCGIYLLVTAAGTGLTELPGSIAKNIRQVLCLQLPDRFAYMELLRLSQLPVLLEEGIPGRGLWREGERALEVQTILPVAAEDDYERMQKLEKQCEQLACGWNGAGAARVPSIPERVMFADFVQSKETQAYLQDAYSLPIGYDMDQAEIYCLDLRRIFCWMILGRTGSGKHTLLQVLAELTARKGGRVAVVDFGQRWSRIYGREEGADLKECREGFAVHKDVQGGKMKRTDGSALEYIDTDQKLYDFLLRLQEELLQKKQKKKELEEKGCFGHAQYEQLAELGWTFFIIENLSTWIAHVRRPEQEVPQMAGFLENITEKGAGLGVFFFAAARPEELLQLAGDAIYRNMIRQRAGICTGGDVASQTLLDFSTLPYLEQKKQTKAGIGMIPVSDGGAGVTRVKLPQMQKEEGEY